MKDRRVLLPLLLAGLVVAGCGSGAGGDGGKAAGGARPAASARTGVAGGEDVRPLRDGLRRDVPPANEVGGFALPVPLPLLALAAGALALAGSAFFLWRRDRGGAQATAAWPGAPGRADPFAPPSGARPPAPPRPAGSAETTPVARGPAAQEPSAASSGPAGTDPLADALAEVAGSGISQALTQQVERLFADGHPGRTALVDACIDCRDQIAERHPRLSGVLLEGLAQAGVREIVADGRRFDPRLHEAFGTEPTTRPELHDVVAETVKRGYTDGERLIRVPRVAVYRHEPGRDGTLP